MKLNVLSLSAALVAALGVGSFALAQDNAAQNTQTTQQQERTFGRGHRGGKMRAFERLNLTDAQKQQIQQIRENARNGFAGKEEVKQLKAQQRAGQQLTAEQTARLTQLREQHRAAKEQTRQQIEAVLTAEQRQQLETLKAERKQNGVADFKGGRKGFGRGGEFGGLRGLNLTDAQREQLRALNQTIFDSTKAQREELRSLLAQRQNNVQLSAEQQARANELRGQIRQSFEQTRQNLQSILTPEQRQQLETQRLQTRQRFEQRRQLRQNNTETPQQ